MCCLISVFFATVLAKEGTSKSTQLAFAENFPFYAQGLHRDPNHTGITGIPSWIPWAHRHLSSGEDAHLLTSYTPCESQEKPYAKSRWQKQLKMLHFND